MFIDPERKRQLHDACVRAYGLAAPHFAVPARPFEAPFRNKLIRGWLRVPPGDGPRPVVAIFNGTNAVKEELHWWADALLARGIAAITLDGPGLGETFWTPTPWRSWVSRWAATARSAWPRTTRACAPWPR